MNHHGQRAAAEAGGLQRGLGICLIAAGLLVAQILLTRAHADPATEALQRIVVLCATEPGSARFDQAWTAWVRNHPQADLEATIRSVTSRASTIRSMGLSGLEPTPPKRQPSPEAVAEHMRALATSARRSAATTPIGSTRPAAGAATAGVTPR